MYELYNYRRCPFCIRVRLVFLFKDISFSQRNEKLRDWTPEFIELFGERKPSVPVLLVDTKPVFESLDIMEFLNEAHPEPVLSNEKFRFWGDWSAGTFRDAVEMYKYGRGGSQEEGQLAIQGLLDELETKVTPYLNGENLSLADFTLWPFVRQAFRVMPVKIEMGPRLKRWFESIENHPKLSSVMEKAI